MISKYKKYRIIHINVNIIIASVVSILLAAYPVYLTEMFTNDLILIAVISFLIDGIIDFGIFSFLHLLVSFHLPKWMLVKDLIQIQGHRIILSIVYFFVAVCSHIFLMMHGFERVFAFLLSYIFALIVTRTIHTVYGLKSGLFNERQM